MKKIRVGFTDTFGAVEQFFTEILSQEYEVIRDDKNPEYLFFGDRNFGENNLSYDHTKVAKILYTGENERPHNYACHFAVTFDHIDDDRHYRLPLYVLYDWDNKRKKISNSDSCNRTMSDLKKDKFCSFIVKNPGCQKRNEFFHRLNAYKRVDSAGPLFNNVGEVLERGEKSVESKLNFLPNYKFNLCFENSSYPGYATEKLFEALCGKTVPIYWGSPTIECDFNPRAFLNWHDYQDDDKFFDAIVRVDNDPELYSNMFFEPMHWEFTKNKYYDLNRFLHWFNKNVYQG